jgi:hypothetical protein
MASHPKTFREILTAAVNDLAEHGYDSQERVERWLLLLRIAAERELPQNIDADMRRQLDAIFTRIVNRGQVLNYVPGVPKYTLEMLRPELRAELDRRILASASLIKLHRAEAIEKTLQRFEGWSTSIPRGGSPVDKVDVKTLTSKALQKFRFEQRRVAIDQGMKLISNVAEIVAIDNGAIAAEWNAVHRSGYENRPEHLRRQGTIFLVRDSWAQREGLVKLNGGKYTDEIEKPAQLPFCSCHYRWITSPRRLPVEMLTVKGRDWVANNGKVAA